MMKIWLRKGIHQNDLLSPLLLNLAIDPLLGMLEARNSFTFSDDLVLLNDSWEVLAKCHGPSLVINSPRSEWVLN